MAFHTINNFDEIQIAYICIIYFENVVNADIKEKQGTLQYKKKGD